MRQSSGRISATSILLLAVLCGSVIAQSQDSTRRFLAHKANYFLFTNVNRWQEAKFQFSVKYRIHDGANLFMAFTQKSFWDAWDFEGSAPFTESNYRPELFYAWSSSHTFLRDLTVGLEHESNGKAGPTSRSWNRVNFETKTAPLWSTLTARLRMWSPILVSKENKNIANFRGIGELEFYWNHPGEPDILTCSLLLNKGTRGGVRYGSFQAQITLRMVELLGLPIPPVLNGAFMLQYWNGMAENLLHYDVPTKSIRLGYMIVP